MNPNTNRFEQLHGDDVVGDDANAAPHNQTQEQLRRLTQKAKQLDPALLGMLLRPNGEPVPRHWSTFQVGEDVVIKDYTFRVKYVGETSILFEPVGPVLVGEIDD
ncbi:hypothetical protein LCGC14_1571450 [marine sediment metagenome]|uniref:Uncharacterized protein n=1 Tax=marine sediment metagenome TaxID=412755 RepID=A0A0F9IJI7_9ZZZZ